MTPPVAVPPSLQPGKHPYWATRCHDCNRMGATRHLVSPSQTPESASRPVLCAACAERWVAEGRPEALFLMPHGTYNHYRANAGKDKQLAYAAILDNNTGYFAKDRRRKNKSIEKKTRADARRQKKLREQLEREAGKRLREQERHLKAMSIAALRAELGQWGVPLVGKKAELLALLREARKTHPVVVSVPLDQVKAVGEEGRSFVVVKGIATTRRRTSLHSPQIRAERLQTGGTRSWSG